MKKFYQNQYLMRAAFRTLFMLLLVCALLVPQPTVTRADSLLNLPPFILLSSYQQSIPIDGEFTLVAVTSTGKIPKFSSSKSSIASVNTYGVVTGKKSGTCKITAKIKDAEASCKVTVEKSTITLSADKITLENGETATLSAVVSTGHEVKWKSSSSATVSVDEDGMITAKKCGTTYIRATADGVTVKCKVTVKKPTLTLSDSKLTLYPEDTFILTANCSSNRPLKFRSSSSAVASVDETGEITAHKKGTATITVTVDGVSKKCKVTVLADAVAK